MGLEHEAVANMITATIQKRMTRIHVDFASAPLFHRSE